MPEILEAVRTGRPTEYLPEFCNKLQDHMAQGFSYETFGATIGVCRATVYSWEKVFPEFLDAKRNAFDLCQLFWERLGVENIITTNEFEKEGNFSRSTSKSLNTGAWVFNMKNRFGWKDKLEVSGDEKAPIKLAYDPRKPKK